MARLDIDNLWSEATEQPSEDTTAWCPKVNVDGKIMQIDEKAFAVAQMFSRQNIALNQWFVSRAGEPMIWGEVYKNLLGNAEQIFADFLAVPAADYLLTQVRRLASHNHYPPYSRFRFTFFRESYNSDVTHWLLMQQRLASHPYSPRANDLMLSNYEAPIIQPSVLSFGGILPLDAQLALREANKNGTSEACLRNTQGFIATTTLGNIYLINQQTVITPTFSAGAQRDALHPHVMRAFAEQGMQCYEEEQIDWETAERASECAIANMQMGLVPVLGLGSKRFYRNKTLKAAEALQRYFS